MIFMSGPCVIESLDNLKKVANDLAFLQNDEEIDFYFKSSFDKANRTSLEGFRGPGLNEGLKILKNIKDEFKYKIITDIHESFQAEDIARVADIIQIPAFLCRQTDLIVEVAKQDCIINIKKGQFMNPVDMSYSVLKAVKTRDKNLNEDLFHKEGYRISKELGVWLTERGSSFGYGNLVVDMRSLVIMRKYAPVIFDSTHSVQMPGGLGGKSGGDSSFVPYLSRAAAAVGVDGFFMESHFDPSIAFSDGPNMIPTNKLQVLVNSLKEINNKIINK